SGSRMKVTRSISMPVDTERPVWGHLIITTPISSLENPCIGFLHPAGLAPRRRYAIRRWWAALARAGGYYAVPPWRLDMAAKSDRKLADVADNRRARFNYEIGEVFEAGIALTGTEVKSLRLGKATIAESYADARGREIWLVNSNIPEYLQGGRF